MSKRTVTWADPGLETDGRRSHDLTRAETEMISDFFDAVEIRAAAMKNISNIAVITLVAMANIGGWVLVKEGIVALPFASIVVGFFLGVVLLLRYMYEKHLNMVSDLSHPFGNRCPRCHSFRLMRFDRDRHGRTGDFGWHCNDCGTNIEVRIGPYGDRGL